MPRLSKIERPIDLTTPPLPPPPPPATAGALSPSKERQRIVTETANTEETIVEREFIMVPLPPDKPINTDAITKNIKEQYHSLQEVLQTVQAIT
jgi:hypothetical protein